MMQPQVKAEVPTQHADPRLLSNNDTQFSHLALQMTWTP